MNKRGEDVVAPEAVNTMFGLIAALLLISATVGVIMWMSSETTVNKNAEKYVQVIKDNMDLAKERPGTEIFVDIEGPESKWWWITGWPFGENIEKPEQCYSNRKAWCICICQRPTNMRADWNWVTFQGGVITTAMNYCSKYGKCQIIDEKVKVYRASGNENPITIDNPPIEIKIKYTDTNKGYEITFVK